MNVSHPATSENTDPSRNLYLPLYVLFSQTLCCQFPAVQACITKLFPESMFW